MSEQRLFVPGPLPGLNELIAAAKAVDARQRGRKRRWNGYHAIKAARMAEIVVACRRARLQPVRRAFLRFEWFEASRRRDPDNVAAGGRKLILDALVAAHVIHDDGWRTIVGWEDRFTVDSRYHGVFVTIREIDERTVEGPAS